MSDAGGAPIELIALDEPYEGVIRARREGEPGFSHVQDLGDAIQAAFAREVDIIVPAELAAEMSDDLPPDLPPYIKIR